MRPIGAAARAILAISVPVLLVAAGPPRAADASLRKCSAPAGSTRPIVRGTPLLMVDGIVVGEAGSELAYSTPSGVRTISTDEILYINVICLEHEIGGQVVAKQAISVGTHAGAEGMMRRYLAELAVLQDGYMRANGVYAADESYVDFYLTRHPLPIEVTVEDGGWSAIATLSDRSCRIAVESARTGEVAPGAVECTEGAAAAQPDRPPPAIRIRVAGEREGS